MRPSFLVQKILGPQPNMGIQMCKRIPGIGIQPAGCGQSGRLLQTPYRAFGRFIKNAGIRNGQQIGIVHCLLYTSDAADE